MTENYPVKSEKDLPEKPNKMALDERNQVSDAERTVSEPEKKIGDEARITSDTLLLNEINDRISKLMESNESLRNRSLTILGFGFGIISLVTTFGIPYLIERFDSIENQDLVVVGIIFFYFLSIISFFNSLQVVLPVQIDIGGSLFELYKKDETTGKILHILLSEKIKQYQIAKPRQFEKVCLYQFQIVNLIFSISMISLVSFYLVSGLSNYISFMILLLLISYFISRYILYILTRQIKKKLSLETIQVLVYFKDTDRLARFQGSNWDSIRRYLYGRKKEKRERTT